MTDNIRKRLAELEYRFSIKRPPSFAEFSELWQMLTPMDRAAYHGSALDERNSVLRGYLLRLGELDESELTLQQIAAELDNKNFELKGTIDNE
ncbi:MAG: hypothetical protein KBS74_07585 [Clostridiales bacterium]|nr:hypothetical protein [Candidatus Cacconaster stercorequi]